MSLLQVNILEGLLACSLSLVVGEENQTAGLGTTEKEISPETQTPDLVLRLNLILVQYSVEFAFISLERPT